MLTTPNRALTFAADLRETLKPNALGKYVGMLQESQNKLAVGKMQRFAQMEQRLHVCHLIVNLLPVPLKLTREVSRTGCAKMERGKKMRKTVLSTLVWM